MTESSGRNPGEAASVPRGGTAGSSPPGAAGRGRRLVVLLATLIGVAVTVSMGRWQLGRAEQKQALQQVMSQRAALPPVAQAALPERAGELDGMLQRRTVLHGRWLARHTVFLDNRQMDGRPGFFVVTPLELAPGDAVLVQRGWAPRDARDRTRLPLLATPDGVVEVRGRVVAWPSRLFDFGTAGSGTIRQNLDPVAFSRETGLRLRPFSVQQEPLGDPDGLQRRWPAPALDVGKHHGYALQWFAMAAVMAGLYVWFQILRPRRTR